MGNKPPEEHLLYEGKVKLFYHDSVHRYYVERGGKKLPVPGVTTITGMLDKSRALVQWAANQTTRYVKENFDPTLYQFNPKHLDQVLEKARFEHREYKENAADIGRQAHDWLDFYFKTGIELAYPQNELVVNAIDAAKSWLAQHTITDIQTERKVYSRRFNYSGILDKKAVVDGEKAIIDWKSGNNIWPESRMQTAAYQYAIEEETKEKIDVRWLIHLDKDKGAFTPYRLPRKDFYKDFSGFRGALRLYLWQKKAKLEKQEDWMDEL